MTIPAPAPTPAAAGDGQPPRRRRHLVRAPLAIATVLALPGALRQTAVEFAASRTSASEDAA